MGPAQRCRKDIPLDCAASLHVLPLQCSAEPAHQIATSYRGSINQASTAALALPFPA